MIYHKCYLAFVMLEKLMTLYEKNILKELYYSDTYYFKIDKAYIKNGMVYIHGLFLNTLPIEPYTCNFIPKKYAPKDDEILKISYPAKEDIGKVTAKWITHSGNLEIWLKEKLSYNIHFQITYPLNI